MKKIYSVILTVILSVSLYASEEALLKAHKTANKALEKLDMVSWVEYIHPEFLNVAADGTVINYQNSVVYGITVEYSKKFISGKYSLLDVMAFFAHMEGKVLSREECDKINALENTADGKKVMAEFKEKILPAAKKEFYSLLEKIRASCETYKLVLCTTSGNVGTVVYKEKDFESGKMEFTVEIWENTDGKWLCKKSVSKFDE